jgi:hypothetical protein
MNEAAAEAERISNGLGYAGFAAPSNPCNA